MSGPPAEPLCLCGKCGGRGEYEAKSSTDDEAISFITLRSNKRPSVNGKECKTIPQPEDNDLMYFLGMHFGPGAKLGQASEVVRVRGYTYIFQKITTETGQVQYVCRKPDELTKDFMQRVAPDLYKLDLDVAIFRKGRTELNLQEYAEAPVTEISLRNVTKEPAPQLYKIDMTSLKPDPAKDQALVLTIKIGNKEKSGRRSAARPLDESNSGSYGKAGDDYEAAVYCIPFLPVEELQQLAQAA